MRDSAVTAKGQTTLPLEVRKALGLVAGDRVRYVILDGEVRIVKAHSVRDLRGMLARSGRKPVSLEEMEDAISDGATEAGDQVK